MLSNVFIKQLWLGNMQFLLTILCDGTLGSLRVSFACLLIIPMNLIRSKRLLSAVGRGADLCWPLGGIICNFTPILPYFQHSGGMNLDHGFFFSHKQTKWRQKKTSLPKLKEFFPRFQVLQTDFNWFRCRPESNYSGSCSKKLLGGIYHPWL